jgi:hypothetical protein
VTEQVEDALGGTIGRRARNVYALEAQLAPGPIVVLEPASDRQFEIEAPVERHEAAQRIRRSPEAEPSGGREDRVSFIRADDEADLTQSGTGIPAAHEHDIDGTAFEFDEAQADAHLVECLPRNLWSERLMDPPSVPEASNDAEAGRDEVRFERTDVGDVEVQMKEQRRQRRPIVPLTATRARPAVLNRA